MSIGRMSRLYSGRDVMSRKNPAPALPNYPLHCGFAMNPQGGVDALWRDRLVIPHLIYALPHEVVPSGWAAMQHSRSRSFPLSRWPAL
jgi:hypothetical protein